MVKIFHQCAEVNTTLSTTVDSRCGASWNADGVGQAIVLLAAEWFWRCLPKTVVTLVCHSLW